MTWIYALFLFSALASILWLYAATRSRPLLMGVSAWAVLQLVLGVSGFYENTTSLPPRVFAFGVLPTVLAMVWCFRSAKGRALMDASDLRTLTWLHIVRNPVEVVLYLLVERHMLSTYMSIHGTNFDVLSGLSAPIIALVAFRGGTIRRSLLTVWNILAMLLLLNVVITAAFAIPSPIQQLAFDQPNIAILRFPMNLLPAVVVPIVIFSHLIALRQLMQRSD